MSDSEQVVYRVPEPLRRRLNVWLRSQGYRPAPMEQEEHGLPTSYRLDPMPIGDDADVGIVEAAHLLYVSEDTLRRWVDTGRISIREARRVPLNEVRRLEDERGGPPGGLSPL